MVPPHRLYFNLRALLWQHPDISQNQTSKGVHESSFLVDTEISVLKLVFLSYVHKDSQCTAKSMYKGEILAQYLLLIYLFRNAANFQNRHTSSA
jgi:hypothetical protein